MMNNIARVSEELNRLVSEELRKFEDGLAGYKPDVGFLKGTYRRLTFSLAVLDDARKRLHAARKALKVQLLEVGRDG